MREMKALISAAVGLLLAAGPLSAFGARPLPRSTPEAQGVSSKGLREFIEALDKIDTPHSVMVLRHGHVIAEAYWKPEAADKPHVMFSLTKSFTSTAVGFAVAEGKLSLDDPVLKFFPDQAPPEPSENLRAMTVRDLLTMSGGHDVEVKGAGRPPTVRQFLAHPVPHKPGTHFQYNTPGSHMLSAIVTKATGQTLREYLTPRLFEPLGIEDPRWDAHPEGTSLGGYGLFLRTEDVAKFGQLYLQKGKWDGKQLLPERWVEQATSKQVSNDRKGTADWTQGYGFQFWRSRHNSYRGDGKDGQFCVVIPDKDVVVAITAQTGDMQKELNVVWDKLLPAIKGEALPEDPAAREKLKQVVEKLEAHPAKRGA
jgi:CubicO group peptidase (beta-lactamase class C family)